jgi:predicted outer membrane repeat protein
VTFRNLRLSHFLSHAYFSARSSQVRTHACPFARFQTSVISLTSLSLRLTTLEHERPHGDGGVFSYGEPNLLIDSCVFRSNSASGRGGAFHVSTSVGSIKVSDSFFINNHASEGGAIYSICDVLSISQTLFDANSASSSSHLAVFAAQLSILDSSFRYGASVQEAVSGIFRISTDLNVDRCSFYLNNGPFIIQGDSTSIDFESCCFAAGDCFLDFRVTQPF